VIKYDGVDNIDEKMDWYFSENERLESRVRELEAERDRLKYEVKEWKARMKALTGEESPDLAGNRIITLRARHAALVEAVIRLENEWDADWPMPYCLVEFLESSEIAKLKAALAEVK
jgi:predicted nuclease with TOPRIM domain